MTFVLCAFVIGIFAYPPSHFSKGKGKTVPLQAWSGPEVSRMLNFPDYMKTAPDGGKFVSPMNRPPLLPGNVPSTHSC